MDGRGGGKMDLDILEVRNMLAVGTRLGRQGDDGQGPNDFMRGLFCPDCGKFELL